VLVVCAIIVVLVIGVVALLAFVIDRGVHHLASNIDAEQKVENQTGISTYPLGFDSTHPPQMDVYKRPIKCELDKSTGVVTATGSVLNHSAHPSSYLIGLSFDGTTDSEGGGATVFNVNPGQTVSFTASGPAPSGGTPDCKITLVLRSDNPKLAPVTTTTG
jgi:hypothetical protein